MRCNGVGRTPSSARDPLVALLAGRLRPSYRGLLGGARVRDTVRRAREFAD